MRDERRNPIRGIITTGVFIVMGLIGMTVLLGSWYTIDEGERGVILRNGAVVGTAAPGLGFKTPWIDSVEEISVQSKSRTYENLQAYSSDQQPAVMVISVNYRIPPDRVEEVYSMFGGEDGLVSRVIDRKVNEQAKNIFGKFSAVTAIQDRQRLNLETQEAVQKSINGPIIIDSVQIENIDFSDSYEQSVEARMLAEVEVQKLRQNAAREKVQAEITVTQAQAKADSVRAEASASAEATRIKGDAEADAIRARGKALSENPSLVSLVQAERWNGQLPTTMVPGSAVPFLSVNPR